MALPQVRAAQDNQAHPDPRWRQSRANLGMAGLAILGILLLHFLPARKSLLVVHGFSDEIGHLLTAFVLVIALRGVRMAIPVWAILIGGVILDLGHISDQLGITHAVMGSSRNGGHSVLAVALIAAVALVDREHAKVWLGIAIGSLSHLWRDMGTGTVPLGWPFIHTVQSVTYRMYIFGLIAIVMLLIGLGWIITAVDHLRILRRQQGRR